jgi:DNA-directed RNA polymerase beta' subunit
MDSVEEYQCRCGKLRGKYNLGNVCPKCEAEVISVGLTIDKCGWIDLSLNKYDADGNITEKGPGFKIIKYIEYSLLEKIIGKDVLKNIIHIKNIITINGDVDEEEMNNIRMATPKQKYYHLGLEKFYEKYSEVLDYYYELSGKKNPEVYEFIKNRDDVFTDKIPVLSIILRPAMRTADGLKLDQINIQYQNILKNLLIIGDSEIIPIIRDATVEQIQAEYFILSENIMDNIRYKAGLIRNQICGTRINFAARNIISPAVPGIKMDEIVVPYLTFLELYRFEIINIIKNTERVSFKVAEKKWYNARYKTDPKIYNIMKEMVETREIGVLLNRNPTIGYGSILYLKIAAVKEDYDDVTMSVHNSILTSLAGDYDGDVLNLISLKDKTTREIFKNVFSPLHMLIDVNSGDFNNALNIERDQVLGMNSLLS